MVKGIKYRFLGEWREDGRVVGGRSACLVPWTHRDNGYIHATNADNEWPEAWLNRPFTVNCWEESTLKRAGGGGDAVVNQTPSETNHKQEVCTTSAAKPAD